MPDAAGTGGAGTDAGTGGAGAGGKGGTDAGGSGGQDFQKVIDSIIARERARSDEIISSLRSENKTLSEKLAKAPKADDGEDDEKFRVKVEAARKPLQDELEKERKNSSSLRNRILKAELLKSSVDSVDPDLVADALLPQLRVGADGEPVVVDKDGQPLYGVNGPKKVSELVADYLKTRPYLVRGKGKRGIGLEGTQGEQQASGKADELRAQIAELEAAKKFVQAGRLKAELARLTKGFNNPPGA